MHKVLNIMLTEPQDADICIIVCLKFCVDYYMSTPSVGIWWSWLGVMAAHFCYSQWRNRLALCDTDKTMSYYCTHSFVSGLVLCFVVAWINSCQSALFWSVFHLLPKLMSRTLINLYNAKSQEFTCLNGGTIGEGAGMVNAIQAAKSLYTCPHSHVNLYPVLTGGWQKIRKKSSLKFIIWYPDWFQIVFLIACCNENLQGRKLSQINPMTVRDALETFGLFLLEHQWFAHCSNTVLCWSLK
jgi:hypothetical protein